MSLPTRPQQYIVTLSYMLQSYSVVAVVASVTCEMMNSVTCEMINFFSYFFYSSIELDSAQRRRGFDDQIQSIFIMALKSEQIQLI